ncbi:hypothetical protein GCM10023205_24870 [Yinghuangia aomiensis]|uniref:Uncharacterized protein n=1 Tax=Yinghuangia aomiensis TaxID=676205 RepID=A0ABP9H5F8_9ACTN
MDAAWIGVVGTVAGAVIAGGVGVALQRRSAKSEADRIEDAKRAEAVALIGGVRAAAQEWLTYLMYVMWDASSGQFATLAEFDERSTELRQQVHQAMAGVGQLGPEDLFYSRFAASMRSIEAEARSIIAGRSRDQARDVMVRTDSFGALFSMRQAVTTRMINDVLDGRWITGPR